MPLYSSVRGEVARRTTTFPAGRAEPDAAQVVSARGVCGRSGAGELGLERRYLAFDLHVVRQVALGAPVPVAGIGAIAFQQVDDAVAPQLAS